jgi:multidrug efflux pump subunit AcrB
MESYAVPFYVWFVIPPSLLGVAIVLAVIRAKPDDLPAIVRALMRIGSDDDAGNPPPSLPAP